MSELTAASALNVTDLSAMSGATSNNGSLPRLSDIFDFVGPHLGALTTTQAFLLGIGVGAVVAGSLGISLAMMRRRREARRSSHRTRGSRPEADEPGGPRTRQMREPHGVASSSRPQDRARAVAASPVAEARHDSRTADIVDVGHASLPAGNGGMPRAEKHIVELAEHVARRLAEGRSGSDPDLKSHTPP
jgi:hypothetical protein